jgi:alpha-1,6-mannosyltransferase
LAHVSALRPAGLGRGARLVLLALVGFASLLGYLAARGLGDLRLNTIGFELAFLPTFALYLIAAALVLRLPSANGSSWPALVLIFAFGLLFRLTLLSTWPTLSDDMFRYVWDGRVQANGLSPYRYSPDAPEVAALHAGDQTVWPHINRQDAVTVYPPGAQMAFAAIWRGVGDRVAGFKAAFVLAELAGGLLLLGLLRALNQPLERVLIYVWSPLLVFEVAHAGHVDGLMLPLLILAFYARVKNRPWLLGLALGAATLVKLFPLLLVPALLPLGLEGPWRTRLLPGAKMLLAFSAILAAAYLPYVLQPGAAVGFLPKYFDENFNLGLAKALFMLAPLVGQSGARLSNGVTFGGLALLSGWFVLRPAPGAHAGLGRCVWLIGWFTLFTQNLFPWYLLWLLPLTVVFLQPGRTWGFSLAPSSAWLIFSGTTALAYMFFMVWRVVVWAQVAEFAPLYLLLALSAVPSARAGIGRAVAWAKAGRRVSNRVGA